MKKALFVLSLIFSITLLSACSSSADYKKISDKIANNEELTTQDYEMMIQYVDDALTHIIDSKNIDEVNQLEEKYPYCKEFLNAMDNIKPGMPDYEQLKEKTKPLQNKLLEVMQTVMRLSSEQADKASK